MVTARRLIAAIIALVSVSVPTTALSWDGTVTGTVASIENWGPNFYFTLDNLPTFCPSSANVKLGLVSASQVTADGVKSILATLIAAKLAGRSVVVYSNNNPGGWGCVVGVVTLN